MWYSRSNRTTSEVLLSYLQLDSSRPITYPISGFIDHVTPKVWFAFYSYLLGEKDEARRGIMSLGDLDSLTPVGYGAILVCPIEQLYLHSADVYLHELSGKWLSKTDAGYCSLNSVVLAHYLRAKFSDGMEGRQHTLGRGFRL